MMNWKDLVNSNFSRKAEIVIVTIAALVYVGTLQATEGSTLHVELAKCGIYGIIWIGTLGIFAQVMIDWKGEKGKVKTGDILSSEAIESPEILEVKGPDEETLKGSD